jgi:hypothetical protein
VSVYPDFVALTTNRRFEDMAWIFESTLGPRGRGFVLVDGQARRLASNRRANLGQARHRTAYFARHVVLVLHYVRE